MDAPASNPLFREHYSSHLFEEHLALHLYSNLLKKWDKYNLVIVCIGTDRSTGDSLGPLIGSHLADLKLEKLHVWGTLQDPVHAVNLEENLAHIRQSYANPYILGIDACLGDIANVGTITLTKGALKPGAAVRKKLPEVGQLSLTGVVNISGFMEYFVLQNTRLSLVMEMAKKVTNAICKAHRHMLQDRSWAGGSKAPSNVRVHKIINRATPL